MHISVKPVNQKIDISVLGKALKTSNNPYLLYLGNPECQDLLSSIDQFVKVFSKNKLGMEQEGATVIRFINETKAAMRSHPFFSTLQVNLKTQLVLTLKENVFAVTVNSVSIFKYV